MRQQLRYHFSIPNYLATRAADRVAHPLLAAGRIPGLALVEADPGVLPGPDWLRLRPRLSGVCGSDLSVLLGKSSPALSPFVSFPAVLGHEMVADVVEEGAAVSDVQPGDRVVVNPVLSCVVRGLDLCPSCARGETNLCLRFAEGTLAPGMLIGLCRDLPGGWSEEVLAHGTQVHRVPPAIPDEAAVLVEPFSVALHAVLKEPPDPDSQVLIVGAGSIGLLTLAALHRLGHGGHLTILARHDIQARLAERLGADLVVRGGADEAVRAVTGATSYQPIRGRPVYAGGFQWVYDCVGSRRSVADSLRVAGPGGRVVLIGCAAEVARLDLTSIWAKELQVSGCYVYGQEASLEGRPHTFEVALNLLAAQPDYPLAALVTHRFPLTAWRDALRVSLRRGEHGAVKTVFARLS